MRFFVWLVTVLFVFTLMACSGSVVQERQGAAPAKNAQAGGDAKADIKQLSDFELQMVESDGNLKPRKLSQTVGQGKVVVIDFWATWCGPCRRSIPDLIALNEKYQDKGVEIFGLSIEDPKEENRVDPSKKNHEAVINMSKDFKINYQVGFAPHTMFMAFDQRRTGSIPQTFIFGKDGTMVKHFVGLVPQQAIRDNIEKALNS